LEHADFRADELDSFRFIMKGECKRLVSGGHADFDRKENSILFLLGQQILESCTFEDDWLFRFSAKKKAIAINASSVPMLPWEIPLIAPGSLTHVRSTLVLPDSMLLEMKNVRSAVLEDMGTAPLTFKEMRREVDKNLKQYLQLDRTFTLERDFLFNHVDKLAIERVHADAFSAFPTGDEVPVATIENCIIKLERITVSPCCTAVGPSLIGEIKGIISLLSSLNELHGPSSAELVRYSPFYQACITKFANFYTVDLVENASATANTKRLHGKRALCHSFKELYDRSEKNETIEPVKVRKLIAYMWLLQKENQDMLKLWLPKAIRDSMMPCALTPIEDGTAGSFEGSKSLSALVTGKCETLSASASSAFKVPSVKGVSMKSAKKGAERDTTKTNMLKFFHGKGKVKA
jgi:hypothetical protein